MTHKTMTTSALRRRRQAIKQQRAALEKELREIEAEMASRKEPALTGPTQHFMTLVDAARGRW